MTSEVNKKRLAKLSLG